MYCFALRPSGAERVHSYFRFHYGVFVEPKSGVKSGQILDPILPQKPPIIAIFLEMILYVERSRIYDIRPHYYYYSSCFVSSSERRGRVSGERNPHTAVRHLCHGAFAALNDESES